MVTRHHRPSGASALLPWTLALWTTACAPAVATPATPQSPPADSRHSGSVNPDGWPPALRKAVEKRMPPVLPHDEDRPTARGYHVEERARYGLLGAGVGVFIAFYAAGGIAAAASQHSGVEYSGIGLVPIFGPLYIASSPDFMKSDPFRVVPMALLGFVSIGQLVGTVMIIGGAVPREVEVRNRSSLATKGPFVRIDARGPALVF